MTKSPVKGNELYGLFLDFNPFDTDLRLKPRDERRTILAANANFPFELQVPAFMKAASSDGGSPVMIQFSGKALAVAGRGIGPVQSITGQSQGQSRSLSYIEALRNGARLAVAVSKTYIDTYNPPFVALALDHFAVPDLQRAGVSPETGKEASENGSKEIQAYLISREKALVMLNKAWDFASRYRVPEPGRDDFEAWIQYLSSFAYAQAVAGFMACLEEMSPAWAMLDTEEMPPVLNYAVTRQVCDLVKERGFNTMLEAEYGSTGQAGKGQGYVRLHGDELHGFARQVAGFVKYTGARGISYPIGMEHAAPSGEKHEPDVERLEAVQREIIKESGYYAPFAQHGGTGAKQLARGLVAKNNINTYFLVTMAQHLLGHFTANQESVRQGKKGACGSNIYISASESVSTAAVEKLEEAGTYGWFACKL
ncbi:MAG: class II fructose-bisphosphate aldolase [Bacillota bacterium]|jgi:fructose/tagatose bisphosphate aldolase